MDVFCGAMRRLDDGVIICGNTTHELVSEECESRRQTTHITTEVKPKRKASTIEGTLESPGILYEEDEI